MAVYFFVVDFQMIVPSSQAVVLTSDCRRKNMKNFNADQKTCLRIAVQWISADADRFSIDLNGMNRIF